MELEAREHWESALVLASSEFILSRVFMYSYHFDLIYLYVYRE